MSNKKLLYIPFLLIILTLTVIACQPREVVVTEIVEKEVVVTQEVEREVIVTQEVEVLTTVEVEVPPPPEGPEGTLRVALSTFPNSLFIPLTAERNADNVSTQLYDSLVYLDRFG